MADFMQFNQNSNDSPLLFSRAFTNKNMNLNAVNLKKRKLLPGVAEDLGLPEPKHKCCEAVADSEYDLSPTCSMVTEDVRTWIDSEPDINSMSDTQGESTQDSSSVLGDTKSGIVDVKVNVSFGNADSYYEASTARDKSGSGSSRNGSVFVDRSVTRNKKDGKEEEKCINQDTSWLDADDLEVCISSQYCHDNSGQTTEEGLQEFITSSGVDPSLFALASERWGGGQDAETHPGRPKPTIDQEFEQYFSTLML